MVELWAFGRNNQGNLGIAVTNNNSVYTYPVKIDNDGTGNNAMVSKSGAAWTNGAPSKFKY